MKESEEEKRIHATNHSSDKTCKKVSSKIPRKFKKKLRMLGLPEMRISEVSGIMFAGLAFHIIAHCHSFASDLTYTEWGTRSQAFFVTGLVLLISETFTFLACPCPVTPVLHFAGSLLAFISPFEKQHDVFSESSAAFLIILPFLLQCFACMQEWHRHRVIKRLTKSD